MKLLIQIDPWGNLYNVYIKILDLKDSTWN